jgi:hypothetical protein
MGRQIQLATTELDNRLIEAFLNDNFEYTIIKSFAPTKEALFINDLRSEYKYDSFRIWNKAFQWEPIFEQVGKKAVNQAMIGYYYVSNTCNAPLIEFKKSVLDEGQYGRIYWGKYFAAPDGLPYDVESFTQFYEQAVKWIIKNAAGKIKSANVNTYFLPEAWEKYGK